MTAFSPLAIANAVLDEAKKQVKTLTIMQLLKLVYIAHGWSLALLNEPLVDEMPEAWQHGPVFPAIYREFRRFGSRPITEKATGVFGQSYEANLAHEQRQIIAAVVKGYGSMHAFALSGITHRPDTPWSMVYKNGRGSSEEIPDSIIRSHYLKLADERRAAAKA